jgi:DNA topoisomerase-2
MKASKKNKQYSALSDREHLLLRPANLLGDDVLSEQSLFVYDSKKGKIVRSLVMNSCALEQTFKEVIGNPGDSFAEMRKQGIDGGELEVDLNLTQIRVKNVGFSIRIEKIEGEDKYWPEILFTRFRSGSNFVDSEGRNGIGMNGYGIKLVIVFSTWFKLRVVDEETGLCFEQEYTDNMSVIHPPKVYPCSERDSVEVTYTLDFVRLGLDQLPQSTLDLYARYSLEMAMFYQVKFTLNGVLLPPLNIESYSRMFCPDQKIVKHESEGISLCLYDTPNDSLCISFVNGMLVSRGGVHVKAVFKELHRVLNEEGVFKTLIDKVKIKNGDTAPTIEIDELEKNISLFLTCVVQNPKFTTQTKDLLKSPTPKVRLDRSIAPSISKWQLIDVLEVYLKHQDQLRRTITDGKKLRHVNVKNLKDANWAAKDNSEDAVLAICEGDSAKLYFEGLREKFSNGCDWLGIMQIRGKILNISKATTDEILDSAEITSIKHALGLRENVDYTIKENFGTLRYGRVLIGVDQDHDGAHIKGLLIRFFQEYPSLFKIGYINSWETPIIRLWPKGGNRNECIRFYREMELDTWRETNNIKDYTAKYYKGLATSEDRDIDEDKEIFRVIQHNIDSTGDVIMNMVFNGGRELSDLRKSWILNWNRSMAKIPEKRQTLTEFVNTDLIGYAQMSLRRAIPSMIDSFKRVQRKAVYTALQTMSPTAFTKVAYLASDTSKETNYHHGEKSIEDTITRMGLDYPCSNNMPFFERKGQFGRRSSNKISAARYIQCRLNWWVRLVFRSEDDEILYYLEDDGRKIEPEYYLPIICWEVVQGTKGGIAMGWSVNVPQHHPIAIADYIKARLRNETPLPLKPWFRGYRGVITVEDGCYITRGTFAVEKNRIVITELPAGVLYDNYTEFLKELVKQRLLRDFEDNSTDEKPRFILLGFKEEATFENLHLIGRHSMTNFNLLDERGVPKHFESIAEIIDDYMKVRLDGYRRRKVHQLQKLAEEVQRIETKLQFVLACVEKRIKLDDEPSKLKEQMKSLGFDEELLKIRVSSITREGIVKIRSELEYSKQKIVKLKEIDEVDIWLGEIDEFVKAYWKHYKE